MKAIWDKFKENALLSILSVLLTLTFVAFVGVLFFERAGTYISELPGLSKKNLETLKFVGIGMGGLLVALQALMSYKRAKALEDTAKTQADAAKAQAKATEEQAKANKLTEQGQRQERLKNAIEHLGHEKDSVRLGGAYELFHLAKDTLKEDAKEKLSQTVFDILCAHIRRTTGESEYRKAYESSPSEEIQSLLTLLFVQDHEVFDALPINLQGTWLNGIILPKARLWGADLTGAHLQDADLDFANLQGALLYRAHLRGAKLHWTHLQKACLHWADLRGVGPGGTKMQGAYLTETNLQGARLIGAQLQGAYLGKTLLHAANLSRATLQGADLTGAQLQAACLDKTILKGITSQKGDRTIFENQIRSRIGMANDLSGVVFEGGLSRRDLESIIRGLPDEKARELQDKLVSHVGKQASHELPPKSGAIIDPYTAEDAEKWIADYKKAVSEVPWDDS